MKRYFIIILCLCSLAQAADTKLTGLNELTAIAGTDIFYIVDDPGGTPLSKKITATNIFDLIDTFSELNTIVADKTLVNEEDAVNWDALGTFGLGITITTGDPFTFGVVRWDNGSDLIDGEQIANDTIDNDSIDWADMTDLTTDGAVSWGNIAEGELADDTVNNADINWADITNLDNAGAIIVADTADATSFVALWESATGSLAAKSDGALTYNATTGALAATSFAGDGSSLTAIDAATGDSATAFFDAGTIEHEWGGLQADISGYTGLIAITGADTTAEIDSLDELEGQLADVTRIVSETIMPVAGTDPDVDAAGELSVDIDGANEPNDVVLRTIDGNGTQVALAQEQKSFQATIIKPNDLADATRDLCPIWSNETGMTFVITKIEAWSDTDDTTVNVEVYDSVFGNNATVDALEIASDGTANYYVTETTITAANIVANYIVALDFDDTDDPGWVKISICGYFLSDVN